MTSDVMTSFSAAMSLPSDVHSALIRRLPSRKEKSGAPKSGAGEGTAVGVVTVGLSDCADCGCRIASSSLCS